MKIAQVIDGLEPSEFVWWVRMHPDEARKLSPDEVLASFDEQWETSAITARREIAAWRRLVVSNRLPV